MVSGALNGSRLARYQNLTEGSIGTEEDENHSDSQDSVHKMKENMDSNTSRSAIQVHNSKQA